jgi:hypothetical protein
MPVKTLASYVFVKEEHQFYYLLKQESLAAGGSRDTRRSSHSVFLSPLYLLQRFTLMASNHSPVGDGVALRGEIWHLIAFNRYRKFHFIPEGVIIYKPTSTFQSWDMQFYMPC